MAPAPEGAPDQPAEARADYRFFRFIAIMGSRLSIAGIVFLLWYLVAYAMFRRPVELPIFLLTTTVVATFVSVLAGLMSFTLFKRRGGRVEKTPPPLGVEQKRKHFGP